MVSGVGRSFLLAPTYLYRITPSPSMMNVATRAMFAASLSMSYAVTVFAPASLRTGNVSACLSTVA